MRNGIVFTCALVAALLLSAGVAGASCSPGDPTGYYQGTAQSKEAGALKVAVNLRCDAGMYAGEVETPLGAFTIQDGSYAAGTLTLAFGQGPTADAGTITLTVSGTAAMGTFRLGADSGTFTVERAGDAHPPVSTVPTLALTAAQWRADLAFLTAALETRHVSPFDFTSREVFEHEVAALDARLGTLDADQAYVQADHLANLIGDGHTYVEFPPDVARFPLLIRRFGDAYRVVAVTAGAPRALLGTRILAIDGNAIRRVHDALLALTPVGETDVLRETRVTNFLNLGIALHGFGIIADRSRARFDLQDETGRKSEAVVQAMTPDQVARAEYTWAWKRPPLYRQQANNDFWFTYLPTSRAVYCSFRSYRNLETNAATLLAFVRAHHAQKLAIDMRLNGGGDFNAGLRFLIEPLAAMPDINHKGRLFVLVGPSTFSAAMSNAAQFRTGTRALLVGETIGERPNSNQEPNEVKLPNSHLALRYSTKRYTFAPKGPNVIVPDVQATPTWSQFKAGDDPALDAVLHY